MTREAFTKKHGAESITPILEGYKKVLDAVEDETPFWAALDDYRSTPRKVPGIVSMLAREHLRPTIPVLCPLGVVFSRPWRVLDDPSCGVDVYLHPGGFHFRACGLMLGEVGAAGLHRAAQASISNGATGLHECIASRTDGVLSFRFESVGVA